MSETDKALPKGDDWTFESEEVAEAFDQHVREQLPWYDLATGIVSHVVRHYLPQRGTMYDIGAATGNIGRAVKPILEARDAGLYEIECSSDMVAKVGTYTGTLIEKDAEAVNYEPFDVATLFLVLMFIGMGDRRILMKRLYAKMKPGGAMLVFDKCVPHSGYPATILSRLALAGKMASSVTPEDIIAKELSLSGIQRPISPEELPARPVEIFRFGDFAGWIVEKDP